MSEGNPLNRPATDKEIAEVERLLKTTTAEIVPMRRPSAKLTTEVLALPMLPALPPMPVERERGPGAVVLPFLRPTGPVWLRRGMGGRRAGSGGRPARDAAQAETRRVVGGFGGLVEDD